LRMPKDRKAGERERETNVTSWCVLLDVAVEAKRDALEVGPVASECQRLYINAPTPTNRDRHNERLHMPDRLRTEESNRGDSEAEAVGRVWALLEPLYNRSWHVVWLSCVQRRASHDFSRESRIPEGHVCPRVLRFGTGVLALSEPLAKRWAKCRILGACFNSQLLTNTILVNIIIRAIT
jgi:hypothetical protein